jgi:hypothetical protein
MLIHKMNANSTHDKQKKAKTDSRLISRLAHLLIDTASAAIDGAVLRSHNRLDRALAFDVTRKAWHFGNDDNNLR